eukprot:757007-Hanusia_phi.AAC.3
MLDSLLWRAERVCRQVQSCMQGRLSTRLLSRRSECKKESAAMSSGRTAMLFVLNSSTVKAVRPQQQPASMLFKPARGGE